MKYFTYGSNLSHVQMTIRCPDSQFLFPVFLVDYKFVYESYSKKWDGAVANIIESPGGIVWGGVYEISKADLASLDKHEHYPEMYNRAEYKVKDKAKKSYQVTTYFRKPEAIDEPSARYRQTTLQGA